MFHALMLWLWNDQYVVAISYMHKFYPMESSNEQNSNSFVEFLEVNKRCLRKIKEKRKKI